MYYNRKFKAWCQVVQSSAILKNQLDIANGIIGKRSGQPVSQGYINRLINGTINITDHHVSQICYNFPFTNIDFFLGNEYMFKFQDLLKYLLKKHGLTQKEVAKAIGIDSPVISKMDDATDVKEWDKVFSYFNENHGYAINIDYTVKKSVDIGSVIANRAKHISDQVTRMFTFMNYLLSRGIVNNKKEFAEVLQIAPNQLTNMGDAANGQDITKDMIVNLASKFPILSLDWLLLGRSEMLK